MPTAQMPPLGRLALGHLEQVVAIDSQSDERSQTIPTTQGQTRLADHLAGFFTALGATVTRDDFANVIAAFPGRGAGAAAPPIALMVHLDTARGTHAVPSLCVAPAWAGDPIPYPANPALSVSTEHYPDLAEFVGHDVVHGPGDAPFGLDDKLGLTHLMTLATLLRDAPARPHPPLYLIGRPDEEVGRMEAIVELAGWLAERGVTRGYTVDGILPFEVNVANFNAAGGAVRFAGEPIADLPGGASVVLHIGGVNTHGATARAERHRAMTRLGAAVLARLDTVRVRLVDVVSDSLRDCDGSLRFALADTADAASIRAAAADVIDPHVPRGASWRLDPVGAPIVAADDSAERALRFVADFLASDPGYPLAAEDSDGTQGYSAPYRVRVEEPGAAWLDVRIRDFEPAGLAARKQHLADRVAATDGATVTLSDQYENMGPRLADHPELVTWARAAGARLGIDVRERPIRGGTGVDPFLDRGVAVANVGTGYFAPESEKELTSIQLMAAHAEWLAALLEEACAG